MQLFGLPLLGLPLSSWIKFLCEIVFALNPLKSVVYCWLSITHDKYLALDGHHLCLQRQRKVETASLAQSRLDPDFSAVGLHSQPTEGKP